MSERVFPTVMAAIALLVAIIALTCALAHAAVVTLAWDAVPDPEVTGYKVYVGTASGTYGTPIDCKNVTTCAVNGLHLGTKYYFAATAYAASGIESGYSNEVSYTVPVPSPKNAHVIVVVTP